MGEPKQSTLTIKSRPKADGSVSWFLYFRPALPDGTTLIPVEGFSSPDDRAKVEAFAKPYREALKRGHSKPKPETCDERRKRFDAYQRECGHTDPTNSTRWTKWVSPRIGNRTPESITRADIEHIRDALDTSIREWTLHGRGGPKGEALAAKQP